MKKLSIFIVFILSSCSINKVPISETYTAYAARQSAQIEIELFNSEVERFIDSNGFIYIRGPFPEQKKAWLELTVWVLKYDTAMPRHCVGRLKNKYLQLFSNISAELNNKQLYGLKRESDEIEIVDHEISYGLRVKTDKGVIYVDNMQLSVEKTQRAIIANEVLNFFNEIGLDPFKWEPKLEVFENMSCT